jgi:hypothetical protein
LGGEVSELVLSFILSASFSFAQLGSTMFGLARNSPSGVFLATMDPTTGIATNLSQTSISSSINLTGAAGDHPSIIYASGKYVDHTIFSYWRNE